ncbi:Magnesium-dependent phosphatase [Phaffia rhodozyma]|uniref:Magnesium-dependent phosphatase n=1 Tax=Phaffia rhodozyma TaxID=264483 RepID=A0A0F7SP69_PHARH|nr:Magnesium-dependent phosphatase [Phaffia rhodozyma]
MPTGKQTSHPNQTGSSPAFPNLVAFDLDYTLDWIWFDLCSLWIDTHVTGPFKRTGEELNKVIPRRGDPISFYPDVPEILHKIRRNEDSYIAACSRTSAPDYAREVLGLLLVPSPRSSPKDEPKRAIDFFDGKEIYPGSKLKHFKRLHEKTGIPYEEMLFFDDESRNKEVESLGERSS